MHMTSTPLREPCQTRRATQGTRTLSTTPSTTQARFRCGSPCYPPMTSFCTCQAEGTMTLPMALWRARFSVSREIWPLAISPAWFWQPRHLQRNRSKSQDSLSYHPMDVFCACKRLLLSKARISCFPACYRVSK